MLILDKLARQAATDAGNLNLEDLPVFRRYVEDTVTELTMILRKGSVYETAVLSVTSGEAILPSGIYALLKVYDTNGVFYDVVDNTEYRRREQAQEDLPTAQVFENVPNWSIRLLNFGTSSTSLSVDYLIASRNPAILPDYYRRLITVGALEKYHLNNSPIERYREFTQKYKDLQNIFKENQETNDTSSGRMKSIHEIDLSEPSNSYSRNNDYYQAGGMY